MSKQRPDTPQSPDNQKDEDAVAFAQGLFELARNGAAGMLVPLLGAGVPVNLRTSEGETLLLLATANNHPKTVQMLLDQGANPDLADHQGQTPLMIAAAQDLADLITALLAAGADPALSDTRGATALDHARAAGAENAVARLTG